MVERTHDISITSVSDGAVCVKTDSVAVEEPLEIVLSYYTGAEAVRTSISITMRTPGDDIELVRGFLFTEGIITRQQQILNIAHQGSQALREGSSNVVMAKLEPGVSVDTERMTRYFYTTSACGVCGKASLEALEYSGAKPVLNDNFSISQTLIEQLPADAAKRQKLFSETGGAHAAAAFDQQGKIVCLREDIGRHNALDKLIGVLTQDPEIELAELGIFVSGRASFELLQKTAMAGFPLFAAVGAPSSLAVELARDFDITLVGFLRAGRFNIYGRADRIKFKE